MPRRILLLLALAAPLAGCFDAPPPPPPPPESVFAAPADQALVKAALAEAAASPYARRANQFRQLVISDDAKGGWRAVCGQASDDGERWKDFVAVAQPGPGISALAVRRDQLDAAGIASCRPLVVKYLGERVRADIAEAALDKGGCLSMDRDYWWAWKSYCSGRLTTPASRP